jgi:hypothetical protein
MIMSTYGLGFSSQQKIMFLKLCINYILLLVRENDTCLVRIVSDNANDIITVIITVYYFTGQLGVLNNRIYCKDVL